ncbi:MAG: lamin tail domain-containing protein [Flavobacteriales bacterium]
MKKLLFSAAVLAVTALQAQDCTEIFFSEYVEGSSKNKALEIYNPTSASIDLSVYKIKRYKNGQTAPDTELELSGNLVGYDVVVITNGETTDTGFGTVDSVLYNMGDLHGTGIYASSPMFFNGNDALTIEKANSTSTDDIVDIFGKVGEDPNNGWNNIDSMNYVAGEDFWTAWTKDHTMVRKSSVLKGVTANPSVFNTGLEYDSLPKNTFTELGSHTCDCKTLSTTEYNQFSFLAYSLEGNVIVTSKENLKNVEFVSLTGQVVYSQSVSTGSFTVQPNLNNGVYVIRLTNDKGQQTSSKIVLK